MEGRCFSFLPLCYMYLFAKGIPLMIFFFLSVTVFFFPFPCGKRLYSCTLRWKIPHVLFTCVFPNFRSTTIFSHTFKSMNIGTTYFWCVTQFSYVSLFYWLSNIVLTNRLCCSLLPQNSVGDILVNVWRFLIWRVWSFQHLAKSRYTLAGTSGIFPFSFSPLSFSAGKYFWDCHRFYQTSYSILFQSGTWLLTDPFISI